MSIRHLKTRKQFQSMLANPPIAKTSHFCLHRQPVSSLLNAQDGLLLFANPPEPSHSCDASWWVGALVPKRWAKHAVTRNLIRRHSYAIALELQRRCVDPADPMFAGADAQEPQAFLIRLRASFHAKSKNSPSSRKKNAKSNDVQATKNKQLSAASHAASNPKPALKSAASALLKTEVRGQIFSLFERAASTPLRSRSTANPSHEAIKSLKEAGQDA